MTIVCDLDGYPIIQPQNVKEAIELLNDEFAGRFLDAATRQQFYMRREQYERVLTACRAPYLAGFDII